MIHAEHARRESCNREHFIYYLLTSYESHATRTCMRTVWYATSRRDLSERWRRYQTGRNR